MTAFFSIITTLFRWLIYVFVIFIQFVIIVALGVLVAIFYALPWVLRIGAVIVWLYGAYLMTNSVGEIYSPFTEAAIPLLALQLFVVAVQIAMIVAVLFINTQLVWGGLYFSGGVPLWLALKGIPTIIETWEHVDIFFRVLPPALWAMMLIYITVKTKLRKSGKKLFLSRPNFLRPVIEKVDGMSPTPPPAIVSMSNFISFDSFGLDSEEETK
ncbi:MAG: hypothetical protein HOD49_18490 [Anaerolineae bacterium]|jgi:hypothetical protein|nr:hypothetical protein [Anaerolineae bacterium]